MNTLNAVSTPRNAIELTASVVARIAYLSSDVIISVQPAQSIDSEFSKYLHEFVERKAPSLVAKNEAHLPEVPTTLSSV